MIKLLYIDLFCGAGGTTTGVEAARIGSGKKAKYCHGTTTQYKYRVKNDKKSES